MQRFLRPFAFLPFFLFPQIALAAGPDPLVKCVEGQLAALGYSHQPVDGRVDGATAAAAKALQAKSKSSGLRALPRFKLETAVGWCREIAAAHPETRKFMPSARPPIVLAHGGARSVPHALVARAFSDTEKFFRSKYGFVSASRVDVAGSHDMKELTGFVRELQKRRRYSLGGIGKILNKVCDEGYGYGGVAYRNQLMVCWPKPDKADAAWQRKLRNTVTGIMVHEYMHHVQRELTNDKSFSTPNYHARRKMGPKWMVEGTAEVAQLGWLVRHGGVTNPGLPGLVKRAAETRKSLRSMRDHSGVKTYEHYTVAHLAAQLLAERFGDQAIFNYWRYVGQGRNWESAFQAAFGIGLADFERQFETLRYDSAKAQAFARARG